jgi:eukaryotic-like serine/threonine-protein kinase
LTTRLHKDGDLIGDRYEIRDFIGEGGMQQVFKARDLTLERDVALKCPKNASAERRFKRSAVLSARVNHPNAARTLDYVEDERPYLIEEFIDGEDLCQLRERLPIMDPYLVAHILHHVARGVSASHHAEVVHRDLKPSNIMVEAPPSFAGVKVTDFGIAKMAEEELRVAAQGGEESITGSQTMIGALPYMAPEMINEPTRTGKAADIWAIGAICFELLSGVKPFGKGLKAVRDIMQGNLVEFPKTLRKPQFVGLMDELLRLISSCLQTDPGQRIQADVLVRECDSLCYPAAVRQLGRVADMPGNSWGFVVPLTSSNQIFFHKDSVYGPRVASGDTVLFAAHDGVPQPRAHPVVKARV